jgi:hypothetical protein
MLRIFIALKNRLPSTRFEPTKLGPNCKHANHYTTEDDIVELETRLTYSKEEDMLLRLIELSHRMQKKSSLFCRWRLLNFRVHLFTKINIRKAAFQHAILSWM